MAMNPIPILSTSPPPFDEQSTEDCDFGDTKWKAFSMDDDKEADFGFDIDDDKVFDDVNGFKDGRIVTGIGETNRKREILTNGDQSSSESEDNSLHFGFNKRLNIDVCEVTSCRSLELPDLDSNIGVEAGCNQGSPMHKKCDIQEDNENDFGDFESAFESKMNLENEDVLNFADSPNGESSDVDFNGYVNSIREAIAENAVKCEKEMVIQTTSIDSSEFDDFADFTCFQSSDSVTDKQSNSLTNEKYVCNVNEEMASSTLVLQPLQDGDDDEFSDFSSPVRPVFNNSTTPLCINEANVKEDEFDDFADFQQSVPSTEKLVNQNETQLTNLVKEVFSNEFNAADLCDQKTVNSNLICNNSSLSLLNKLQCLEETPSLKLKWQTSHSFQMFLNSLKIDPRNILHNPCVPRFAAGLGLLEPIRSTQQVNSCNDAVQAEIATNNNSIEPLPIPPVKFDWSSSGLINPLESASTAALDFDIFMTADKTGNKKTVSNLEEELLKPDLVSSNDTNKSSTVSDTLQQLMSNTKYSSIPCSLSKRPKNLSAEANQILDELPVLSFIRAKVLMFPVNGSN